jgi:GrpB-like predicted nucleotidyltransferase (UPF0157 family)
MAKDLLRGPAAGGRSDVRSVSLASWKAAMPATIVVPYDRRWPSLFEAERESLGAVLGGLLAGDVHHVGSTAVPGMPAKPVIDMVAGVRNLADADRAEPLLTGLGYHRAVHRVDAVLFNRISGEVHTHHLHLTVPGSDLWRERLAFRDALRADPALVSEYTRLKQRLLDEAAGHPYSAAGKRTFVRRALEAAGVDLKDGLYAHPAIPPGADLQRGGPTDPP